MNSSVPNPSLFRNDFSELQPRKLSSLPPQASGEKSAQIAPDLIKAVNKEYEQSSPSLKRRRIEPQSLLEEPSDPIISIWAPPNNFTEKLVRFASGKKYDGGWLNGNPHGQGLLVLPDGRRIKGEFDHGKLFNGRVFYPENDPKYFYAGPLQETLPHGYGVLFYADKSSYEGEFKDGLPHGKGRLVSQEKTLIYSGGWKDGVRHGNGIELLTNGTRIEGQFINGEATSGKIFYQNGTNYRGAIRKGLPDGSGILVYPGISSYEGEFVAGNRHGKGRASLPDGALIHDGEWENDLPQGQGMGFLRNGELAIGRFDKGFFQKQKQSSVLKR